MKNHFDILMMKNIERDLIYTSIAVTPSKRKTYLTIT